jgi:hypothetical protein
VHVATISDSDAVDRAPLIGVSGVSVHPTPQIDVWKVSNDRSGPGMHRIDILVRVLADIWSQMVA